MVESYALVPGGAAADRRSRWATSTGAARSSPSGVAIFAAASRLVRLAPEYRAADRRPGPAGHRRRAAGAGQPGADQRVLSRGDARPRDRHLVRFHLHHRRHRSGAGRMVHRARVVAMGILHQSAARARGPAADRVWKVPESSMPPIRRRDSTGRAVCWPRSGSAASSLR